MARGASREQAEDATQDALLRAWKYRARIRAGSDPAPWVMVIAQRELQRNHSRAHCQHEISSDPQQLPERAETEVCAEQRIDVRRALAALTAADRLALLLRYETDLTQPQLAVALDVPEGTAKIRLHRARLRLRQALQDPAGGERESAEL